MNAIGCAILPDDFLNPIFHFEAWVLNIDARVIDRAVDDVTHLADFTEMFVRVEIKGRHVTSTARHAILPERRVLGQHPVVVITLFLAVDIHEKLTELGQGRNPIQEKSATARPEAQREIKLCKLLLLLCDIRIQHRVGIQVQALLQLVGHQEFVQDEPSLKTEQLVCVASRVEVSVYLRERISAVGIVRERMMLNTIIAIVLLVTDQIYRGFRIRMPGLTQAELQVVAVRVMQEDDGQC